MREEAHELVFLYDKLIEEKANSPHPIMFDDAITQTRRRVLGMYRQMTNHWVKHYEVPAQL